MGPGKASTIPEGQFRFRVDGSSRAIGCASLLIRARSSPVGLMGAGVAAFGVLLYQVDC